MSWTTQEGQIFTARLACYIFQRSPSPKKYDGRAWTSRSRLIKAGRGGHSSRRSGQTGLGCTSPAGPSLACCSPPSPGHGQKQWYTEYSSMQTKHVYQQRNTCEKWMYWVFVFIFTDKEHHPIDHSKLTLLEELLDLSEVGLWRCKQNRQRFSWPRAWGPGRSQRDPGRTWSWGYNPWSWRGGYNPWSCITDWATQAECVCVSSSSTEPHRPSVCICVFPAHQLSHTVWVCVCVCSQLTQPEPILSCTPTYGLGSDVVPVPPSYTTYCCRPIYSCITGNWAGAPGQGQDRALWWREHVHGRHERGSKLGLQLKICQLAKTGTSIVMLNNGHYPCKTTFKWIHFLWYLFCYTTSKLSKNHADVSLIGQLCTVDPVR